MRLGANAAAMGSLAEQKRLDVIANNMANANTVAFKRDETYFRDFLDQITYTTWPFPATDFSKSKRTREPFTPEPGT